MNKVAISVPKTNGTPIVAEKSAMAILKSETKPEDPKDLTLEQKIHKVENLQLVVTKRNKLVNTRQELDRFQVSSNDFNCKMQLSDSDGNTFTTNFTPGIKKVIEFLKLSFDQSISDVEKQIKF
ncbi:MAG: hypothetical protein ABSE72_07220 [Bacteroidales bacterium]|jgi:ABC-type uncharacterized transport system permease subunit